MADVSSSTNDDDSRIDDALGLGWHLRQGRQLSASYAAAAEEAGKTAWADFFRTLETSYDAALREGGAALDALLETPMEGGRRRTRPPF